MLQVLDSWEQVGSLLFVSVLFLLLLPFLLVFSLFLFLLSFRFRIFSLVDTNFILLGQGLTVFSPQILFLIYIWHDLVLCDI